MAPGSTSMYFGDIYSGGRHWATNQWYGSAATTMYLLADWLGGLRMWKDQSGNTDLTCENFPFGDGKTCQGGFSTTWGVFGDENDSEDNTYHTDARQHSPTQGRWLTPDPACGATPPGLAEILGLPTWDDVLNPIMDANPAGNCMPGTAGCFNVPTAQQPCYGGSSLTDKTVRFFSLLRLPETWTEWVGGGAAKLTFFGAAKAGATSAGGAEGLGSTAIGIGGEVFGGAGSVAIIGATMADFNCQIGPVDPYTGK
jgi:hypothetical protein